MKYGIYIGYWLKEWLADFPAYCEKVAKLGFDVMELAPNRFLELSNQDLADLKRAATHNGITITSCIGLEKKYDTASEDETVRRGGIEYLKKIITLLDKVDIRCLGGIIYSHWPVDYSKPIDRAKAWELGVSSMRELADFASDYGVMLLPELVNRFENFMFNDTKTGVRFLKDIDRPNVKLLMDVFHMNIEEDNLGDAFRYAGDYCGAVHVGETNRKTPGKGHMPWTDIAKGLQDINFQGVVTMEPFVREGGTVGDSVRVWRDLSDGATDAELDVLAQEALAFLKTTFTK